MKNIISLNSNNPEIIIQDEWQLLQSGDPILNTKVILPLRDWLEKTSESEKATHQYSVWLAPDDEVEVLEPWLNCLPIIAIQFPSFRDGRGYTQAYMLRTRLGWKGELRAFGDVLRDQLSHMRHCGFTSFAVREDKSVTDALKGLAGMSVVYGTSAIEPRPLFRRR